MDNSEQAQKRLFDNLAEQFEAHYDDKYSRVFRDRFMNRSALRGIDLVGKRVLEAMCGSGQTTRYALDRGAKITGLDISEKLIQAFQHKYPQCEAICASILDSGLESNSFDVVVIMMGLHHLPPHIEAGVREMLRVLKPGGYLVFCEPHKGSFPDIARRAWYRRDRAIFQENEEAVNVEALKSTFAAEFDFKREDYGGNVAYMLVWNSLIFRVPKWLKNCYSPVLLCMEKLIGFLQGKKTSCFVACQWLKRAP